MQSRKGLFAALVFASSLLSIGVYLITMDSRPASARDNGFRHEVRNALNEIGFASGGGAADRAVTVENLSAFISYRAGVLLSDARQESLTAAENAASASGRTISKEELTKILTSLAVARLSAMTDDQLESAVESLRGFTHPDLPEGFTRGREFVSLRANGQGRMRAEELRLQIQALRGAASGRFVGSLIRNAIALEIDAVCDVISDADPEFFRGPKCGMSPAQAFLVSYAVVTDDLLAGNRAEIFERMRKLQETAASESGAGYPHPAGHTPYGRNGYIFSTPSDLLFDEATATELIERLSSAVN